MIKATGKVRKCVFSLRTPGAVSRIDKIIADDTYIMSFYQINGEGEMVMSSEREITADEGRDYIENFLPDKAGIADDVFGSELKR